MYTRFPFLLLHELGHAYGIGWGSAGGAGEAIEVENAARRALGLTERPDHSTYPPIEKKPWSDVGARCSVLGRQ
jgi:hypothetical protein